MLSRRHLRKRALQALYAYYQSEEKSLPVAEKQLLHGIERTSDLLYFLLEIIPGLAALEHVYLADAPKKLLERSRVKHVRSLGSNFLVNLLSTDVIFRKNIKEKHISWQNDMEMLRQLFSKIRKSDEYIDYITKEGSRDEELAFCIWLFRKYVVKSESISQYIEEKNIFWADGFLFASEMAIKIIKSVKAENNWALSIPPMYRDERDDKQFVHTLLYDTVRNDAYFEKLIREKAKNWELDRIAMVDTILMKMTLTEILHVESVPVKVSINEYLEIAKEFSTPKSRIFINGIIDKLVLDLRSENKIVKTGRGLLEQ